MQTTGETNGQPARGLLIDDLYPEVVQEIQAAEQDVVEKTAALAASRERLAAARGKMDLLGQMQRRIMAQPDGQAT